MDYCGCITVHTRAVRNTRCCERRFFFVFSFGLFWLFVGGVLVVCLFWFVLVIFLFVCFALRPVNPAINARARSLPPLSS